MDCSAILGHFHPMDRPAVLLHKECSDQTLQDSIEVRVGNLGLSPSQFHIRDGRLRVRKQPSKAKSEEIAVPCHLITEIIQQVVCQDMEFANVFASLTPATFLPLILTIIPPESAYSLVTEWRPLIPWLKSLVVKLKAGDEGYRQQNRWWNANGKSFPFLRLPTEMQETICWEALGEGHLFPLCSGRAPPRDPDFRHEHIFFGIGHNTKREYVHHCPNLRAWYNNRYKVRVGLEPEVPEPNVSILRVSKAVNAIALPTSALEWKHFTDYDIFRAVAHAQRLPTLDWLKRIELSFTNRDYFRMFGFVVSPEDRKVAPDNNQSPPYRLPFDVRQLIHLSELTLRFNRPRNGSYGNPWQGSHPLQACQRVVVDWIMVFAYPQIRNVRTVTLTGDVRTATKVHWEALLRNNSHVFDHPTALAAILATPGSALPPTCFCNRWGDCSNDRREESYTFPPRKWPVKWRESKFDPDDTPYPPPRIRRRKTPKIP